LVNGRYRSFKDLIAWQRGMDLAVLGHRLAGKLPNEERFALANQIRRSASSIPANIAEGAGRGHTREYLHSLKIALGSLNELETHLLLGLRQEYFEGEELSESFLLIEETGRLLGGLIKSLRRKIPNHHP
jgi:four helix bundle protein